MAKLNKSTSTSAKMKASGAGYSTTSRSGKQTFYSSSSDSGMAKPIGTSKVGVSVVKAPDVGSVAPATLPGAVSPSSVPNIDVTNSTIANPLEGLTSTKGVIEYDPSKTASQNQADMSQGTLGTILGALGYAKPQDAQANEKAMKQSMRDSGYTQAQKDVALYTGQINSITNQRDAQVLSLEDQGRGQTTSFLGGEQARIQREAAIQAMPVQAQLAAAQGNLEAAKGIMGMLYQAKSADIQAQASYRQQVANALIGFATSDQQARMQAGLADRAREDTIKLSNVNYLRELSNKAIEYGNTGALSALGSINPSSPTFEADVARAASMIQKPAGPTKRDTAFDAAGNLVDMQTGEIISTASTSGSKTLSGKPQTEGQAKANTFADRLQEAEIVLADSDKFASFFARGGVLPNVLKTEDRQEFEQAQRNFINAVLRRESGAVIADSEFENARLQYFPQPGDSDGVLAQKKMNRNTVINGFYREASVLRPANAGDIIESGGLRYKVAEDGVTLIQI